MPKVTYTKSGKERFFNIKGFVLFLEWPKGFPRRIVVPKASVHRLSKLLVEDGPRITFTPDEYGVVVTDIVKRPHRQRNTQGLWRVLPRLFKE